MSYVVDAKGKPCPTPVILAKQAMAEGHDPFTVLVDNPTARENVTRYAVHQGYNVSVEEKDGEFTLSITK